MTTQLTFIGDDTAVVASAGTITVAAPGGMIDPSVLVVCILQQTSHTVTPPSGWTVQGSATSERTEWVREWTIGDPTSFGFAVGDAAIGMLVAIGNADLSITNQSVLGGGGADATKIETPAVNYTVSDPYRPFAYIGFGIGLGQVGSFTDFEFGTLIGEVADGGNTLVGGYQLDLPPDGTATPVYHFTGANATVRAGTGIIVRFSGIPGTPDCPGTAGWAVSVS